MRWSFSKWETYFKCPAKYRFRYEAKLPEPTGPAAQRGLQMHDMAENYIKGLHDDTSWLKDKKIIPILDDFRHHPNGDRYTEKKLAFDEEWYQTPHTSPRATCVGVLDAARAVDGVLYIGEWKSGKPKETHVDQRKLYALFGLRAWLGIKRVEVTTYYFDGTGAPQRLVADPATGAEERLKALWDGRVDTIQNDTIKSPKASDECFWCSFARKKGGPCPL